MKKLHLLLIVALSVSLTNCTRIGVGNVGIKVNQYGSEKGVIDATECTGFFFYNPIKYDVYEYPITIQHKEYANEESFIVNSKDGAEFHVSPIINYSVKPEMAVSVFKSYKKELPDIEIGFLKTAVYDAFRIATNSFSSDSLMIIAKGEAEANRLRQQSLTPMLIQQQFISKWNGSLPTYGTVPQIFRDISK